MYREPFAKLLDVIKVHKPQTYCEIGLHNGFTARQTCDELIKYNSKIYFEGYDAFETVDKKEANGKSQSSENHYKQAIKRLESVKRKSPDFTYKIYKGYTTETLKPKKFDLVYIDGGHSYDTVLHDYNMVKDSKIILFDDYNYFGVANAVEEIGKGELFFDQPQNKNKKWIIFNI